MTEFLNEKEQAVLEYFKQRYEKDYTIYFQITPCDYSKMLNDTADVVMNILRALFVRGYIYSDKLKEKIHTTDMGVISLTEKSLNRFNARQ